MDFANYFPSIQPIDFIKHIEKYKQGLEDEDRAIVSSLFFYKRTRRSPLVLSIGAPTSPYISNTILFDFDTEVYTYCSKMRITYTRYADDLVFSTNEKDILFEIPDIIQNLIEKQKNPRLTINEYKTKFLSKSCNRHVTGLVISNDGNISIGRKKKRQIKSMVYSFSKNQLSVKDISYLRGYLSYCNSVDKEFLAVLYRKYGESYLKLISDDG